MYERTKEAQMKFHEEGQLLKERKEGLWMLSTNDNTIKIVEPSELPQIGGLMKMGNAELMSMKYFLRQSTRRYGTNYQEAANMLIDWHQKVGMPRRGQGEIRNELDQVCSIISDDVVKRQLYLRIKDAAEETEEPDESIIALTASNQNNGDQQELQELYYQYPMTWLTHIANLNPKGAKMNNDSDKRNFNEKGV